MVSTPAPPVAPDPVKVAQAQSQTNKDSAIAQNNINTVNQVTPQGNLTYKTDGYNSDGTPIRTATTSYSPEQQQLYDLGVQTQKNVGQIGVDQSSRIGKLLGTPVNLNNEATESRLMDLGRSRLDPVLSQRRSSTETDLINRGITPGTEAYDRAMKGVGQQENDAYNQLMLTGRGQAVQEALTERNQPLNEISALLSSSQVSQPNFINNTPTASVAPTDYMGAVNMQYQGQQNAYNQQMQSNNAMIGGLAGLGGAIGGAALGGWGGGSGITGSKKPWFMGS